MKKFLIGLLSLVLIVIASVTLVGCNDDKTLSFETAYDYSAITGIGILTTETAGGNSAMTARTSELDQTQKDQITENLALAQNLANNGVVRTKTVASDRQGYEFYYTVTATDYTGTKNVYHFYYNRTDVSDAEDIRENEREYRLDGLVILNGTEFTMSGEQEVEQGEEEFTFKVSIDTGNYVIIEQETETNETEFGYTVYKNGVKVYEREVGFEIGRNGRVELEFEIYDRENAVNKEYGYAFFTRNGENFARVEIQDGKNTVFATVKITQTQNGFVYEFVNN